MAKLIGPSALLRTLRHIAPLLMVPLAFGVSGAIGACGDTGESGQDIGIDAIIGGSDFGGELPEVEIPATGDLTVDTGVGDDAPNAGVDVGVFCSLFRPGTNGAVLYSPEDYLRPATSWEIVATPPFMTLEPERIDGDTIRFRSAGEYLIRCKIDDTDWEDPTPVKVTVYAGEAVTVDTVVDPNEVSAGDTATVTCTGRDAYDNEIALDWNVLVAPGGPSPGAAGGMAYANFKIKGQVVGTYNVLCVQAAGMADPTPALVTVVHGLPYRLVTTTAETSFPAGGSTAVACHAEDKYGNTVPDLPLSFDLPTKLSLSGFAVTGTKAGLYTLRCVPVGLDWTAFVLEGAVVEIVPGAAVSLELAYQPNKAFFAPYEKVTMLILARDAYENIVADAGIEPLVIGPGTEFNIKNEIEVRFFEEGFYTVSARLADTPSVVATVDIAVSGSAPTLTIEYPERGAMLQGSKPSVTVVGRAAQPIVAITEVRVNDKKAKLKLQPDGTMKFSYIIIPRWGMNILTVEATDEAGEITSITQSFYFAEKYYPLEPSSPIIGDAVKTWIDRDFIDDGVHNPTKPDDLATIIEGAFAGLDLGAVIGESIPINSDAELKLSNLSFNPPKISLNTTWGGIDMKALLKNMSMDIKIKCKIKVLGIDICPDPSGSIAADQIEMDATILSAATKGVMTVDLTNIKVNLVALDIDIDGILGWMFDWLLDFLVAIFTETIEDTIEDQMDATVASALSGLVNALAISETFDIPAALPGMSDTSLTFQSNVWSLEWTPDGGLLGLGASLGGPKGIAQNPIGTIGRGTCLKGYPVNWNVPGETKFEIGLFDDLMNSVLTSIWFTGLLNLELDQDALAELMGDGVDAGGLPIDGLEIRTTALLPPILNGCDPNGQLAIQLGDMFVDVTLISDLFEGGEAKIGVYMFLEITADILSSEGEEGTILSVVLNEVSILKYHWVYVPELFEGSEDALEQLLEDQLIDGALGDLLGQPLGNIAIPELALGELSEMFPADLVLTPLIDTFVHESGHTFIQGTIE